MLKNYKYLNKIIIFEVFLIKISIYYRINRLFILYLKLLYILNKFYFLNLLQFY